MIRSFPKMNAVGLLVVSLMVASLVGYGADFAPAPPNQSDYLVDAWTPENGLPQNSILCMAQTPDGYLWLGTFNGLTRFDGVRFVVLNPVNTPALRSARITGLNVDTNGWLWIVSEEGFVTRLAGGKLEAMNGKWGLPDGAMSPRGVDPSGNICLGIVAGRELTLAHTNFVERGQKVLKPGEFRQVSASSRALWFRTENGWERVSQDFLGMEAGKALGSEGPFLSVPARDGDVWLIGNHAIGKLRAGPLHRLPDGLSLEQPTDAVEDAEGNLLIGTWSQGTMIYSKTGDVETVSLNGGSSALAVRTVLADREGNLWIGTDLAGLQRIRKKTFRTFIGADKASGDVIRSVTRDGEGRIWRVTPDGIDLLSEGGQFENVKSDKGVWWSVATASDGQVWAGAVSSGLCRFEGTKSGTIKQVKAIRSLAADADRGVWVGTEFGLWHATPDSLAPVDLPKGLRTRDVRAILQDRDNLWVGLLGGGVLRRSNEKWESFGSEEGLADLQVVSLYSDADGVIWVGTVSGGLHRLKENRFKNFKTPDSTMPATVLGIIEDDLGYLWLGSLNGIYRVARKELNAFAEGLRTDFIVQIYGRGNGLGTAEMSEGRQPTVCKGKDGRLWFATINGLSVVDPHSVPFNPVSPSVVIEEVSINGTPAEIDGNTGLKVPPLSKRVDFRYTGISLKEGSRVRFKRRLQGLEESWVDVGAQRSATYYNLPPGNYRFQVIAANEDGIWNPSGATVKMRALSAWWQTFWFKIGCGLALGGLGMWAVRFRLRGAARAQAAREAFSQQLIESQEQERRRISAELHDGLGQTLLIAKHQASLAAKAPGIPPEAIDRLTRVSESTQAAIDEVRGIVSALHPAMLDSIGLSGALSSMLQQAAQSGDVKLTWNVENMDGAISGGHEIELFRVVQEALNNVVKHSHAASARVNLRREPTRWILEIEDDGCGFVPGAVADNGKPGGFGLNGMRERIRILAGVLTIDSRRGEGTLLRAEAPIHTRHER